MQCPHCGKHFPHNCASEMGRKTKGLVSEKKSASSRENMRKAIAKRWPKKIEEKGE